MVSKEEFNKVFKDTSREGILNQFYYEHTELGKMIDNFNELEKELEDMATLKTDEYGNTRKITHIDINWLLTKIKELEGSDK